MSKDHGPPSGAFVNFLAAIVKATPRDLSDDLMELWSKRNSRELARRLREVLGEYPRGHSDRHSIPVSNSERPLHKDIRIEFETKNFKYVALGFLNSGEDSIECHVLLNDSFDGLSVYMEDCSEILESQSFLPEELFRFNLLTANTTFTDKAIFLAKDEDSGKLEMKDIGLGQDCDHSFLVLRRLPNPTD